MGYDMTTNFMSDDVRDYLNSQANERESVIEFIRNSENEFYMEKMNLFELTLVDIKKYVDFLEYL